MPMKVACVVPPVHFDINEVGHGYKPPLGLLALAGPLLDSGFEVELLDADAGHLTSAEVAARIRDGRFDVVLIGHSGAVAGHPSAMECLRAIKDAAPQVITVYGGVYATFAAREILADEPQLDFIVCGEGEETALALLSALRDGQTDLSHLDGLVWRRSGAIAINRPRRPIADLDRYRVAWELVDWQLYPANDGPGRSAVVQFARGCPHRCTYCGQWSFWRKWRHRSIDSFVDELELLRTRFNVRSLWLADENVGVDRALLRELLEKLAARQLDLHLYIAMRAADVVRDAEMIDLYRRAGIVCLMMGVESLEDAVQARVGKNNPLAITRQAVELLRQNGIFSVLNVIYGLGDETVGSVGRTLGQLRSLNPDFLNALHVTPLPWTAQGLATDAAHLVEPDQRRWDFRKPVIAGRGLGPLALAIAVKLSELLFFLRPLWLLRCLFDRDRVRRDLAREAVPRMVRYFLREVAGLLAMAFSRNRRSPAWWLDVRERQRKVAARAANPALLNSPIARSTSLGGQAEAR